MRAPNHEKQHKSRTLLKSLLRSVFLCSANELRHLYTEVEMATPVQSPLYQATTTTPSGFQTLKTETGGPIFKSYGDYLVATQKNVRPSSSYNATVTTNTGFMEFKPRDMEIQRKYDAMSPSWEGVDSSMKAVEQGVYSLDSAEAIRQELREKVDVPDGRGPTTLYLNQNAGDLWASFKGMLPAPDDGIPDAKEPEQALWPPVGNCGVQ
jgi:hypothetical protein